MNLRKMISKFASPTCVYVIQAEHGPIKVGFSTNPGARATGIQTSQDRIVNVVWAVVLDKKNAMLVEKAVHKALAQWRSRPNSEWFDVTSQTAIGAVIAAIKAHKFDYENDLQYGYEREGSAA